MTETDKWLPELGDQVRVVDMDRIGTVTFVYDSVKFSLATIQFLDRTKVGRRISQLEPVIDSGT